MSQIDEAQTRQLLRRIVSRVTSNPALREDLMQEALIHLWLLEERRPGQTRSWYLQNCKYHLGNIMALGRSVDSLKRRSSQVPFSDNGEDLVKLSGKPGSDDAVLAVVSARDIITLLSQRLSDFERAILRFLEGGLGAREIAAKLKVSHPTVIKHRRRIAAQALKLGITPLSPAPKNHARNTMLARVCDP